MDDLNAFLKLVDTQKNVWPDSNKRFLKKEYRNDADISNKNEKEKNISDIVGINIIHPDISYQLFVERMAGLTCTSLSEVFSKIVAGSKLKNFVTAGVITNTFSNKVDQKGSPYTIWKITALNNTMDIYTIFLFKKAHLQFWKTPSHKVVLFFNPKLFKNQRFNSNEICLSLDNPLHIILLGDSKDLGTCKSQTKNGRLCESFVNLQKCEFCIHHIKQHHKSYTRYSGSENFANKLTSKRITNIDQNSKLSNDIRFPSIASPKISSIANYTNYSERRVDNIRYSRKFSVHDKAAALQLHALKIIGTSSIEKKDPNAVKKKRTVIDQQRATAQIISNHNHDTKRIKLDDQKSSNDLQHERKKLIMEATSKHTGLVGVKSDEEEQKYFNKLEKREAMEDIMLHTLSLKCKAVVCKTCKYTSFSAANKCLQEKHNTQIIDAEKKFFVCNNCGNRTVSLFRLPKYSCENCFSSNWKRTSMMKNNICVLKEHLSIRGDEVKFL